MPKIELVFEGYDQQNEFLTANEKTVVFQAGAGAGKTYCGAMWVLKQAIEKPGSRGMAVSPSHPQMEQSFLPHLMDILRDSGLHKHVKFRGRSGRVDLPWNGSRFWLRSADRPESLLGADLAWIYGDEVALWKQNAWKYCTGRLRQPGYENQFAITMTPKGRNWAFRRLSKGTGSRRIVKATTFDNIYIRNTGLWERMQEDYGEGTLFWEQEAMGEYVAYEGLIYPFYSPEVHVVDLPKKIRFETVVCGVDWGWSNPFVMLVGGITAAGHLWILEEVYETQRGIEWMKEAGRRVRRDWNVETFYADPSEPTFINEFKLAGLNCQPANNEVVSGIGAVNGLFRNNRLFIVRGACPNLERELEEYKWQQNNQGEPKPDRPEKDNDHSLDALRYLWNSHLKAPISFMQVL